MYSKCQDLIKQHIYHFSLSLFYPKGFLLFPEFINIISILFYKFIELIILLYSYLVISFARYKEYMIGQISFSKFSNVLPTITCARAISNL